MSVSKVINIAFKGVKLIKFVLQIDEGTFVRDSMLASCVQDI